MTDGPRSGARDNGLRCAGYSVVGDLDPRVADSLLTALRDEGIAAYVTPTPGSRGGYLEMRMPARLTDRLYADTEHVARARALMPPADTTPEIDFDAAWEQVVRSLQSPTAAAAPEETLPSWPSSENVDRSTRSIPLDAPVLPSAETADDPEDHFVPPPPPPFPRLRGVTLAALAAIVLGLVVLATNFDGGSLFWLAIVAIVAGAGALVWHMKDGPPADSGWDDGAVV